MYVTIDHEGSAFYNVCRATTYWTLTLCDVKEGTDISP